MRRASVTYRPGALLDLQRIYEAIADVSQNHAVAKHFVQRMMERCSKIGEAPFGGRPRDDLEPGLRTVPFERSAVITSRVTDVVEITNIFYGGRDYEALYPRDIDA